VNSNPEAGDHANRFPFAAEGGISYAGVTHPDPFAAFFSLMEVVAMLCPNPPPHTPLRGTDFRL
jgi:hypothetical protein